MPRPLVSILIPCFNAARWLPQTLESALAQSCRATEIIVVDDGSRDDSLAIARGFGKRGVNVFAQANAGASAARNRAVREAKGDFFQFLDADDLLSPDKINLQLELLQTRPGDVLASCAWGRFVDDIGAAQFRDDAVFRDFQPLDFLILAGETGAMMHPSAWLVPRAIAERAGPWNESLSLNDDGEYFCRVLLASAGVAFCADERARSYYRSRVAGSLSQRRDETACRSQFDSVALIASHLRRVEDSPRTRQAAANYYQRFIHDYFPAAAPLMRTAGERVAELGGSTIPAPEMGRKTAALARLIGWRNARRLKNLLQR
jgi:glycosyltransferase involved in cell wall biosynthesis